ncbi:MAG TPA: sugar nucleotide-binding protein [Candidatus Acidoferrum sp.]|nr:sugar nucleotide-binding protein [Candidatus Acidoferrum sp.]
MRFLIVGASGFIGGNILAYVRSLGFEAVGTQARSRRDGLVTFDLLRHRIADRVDRSFFQATEPVHVLICAVLGNVDLCLTDRGTARAINVEKTVQLIDDITALGAKTTFFSTGYVFDGQAGYYNEDAPVAPINEYGRHKVEVEEHLRRRAPGSLVLRLEKIIGDNPAENHFLAQCYKSICANQPILAIEGAMLSPTWVMDVARGFVRSCEMGLDGLYHLSNSECFYRDELARQFCHALGKTPNVITKPLAEFHFAEKRPLKSYLDGSRFVKKTGLHFTPVREVFHQFIRRLPPVPPN